MKNIEYLLNILKLIQEHQAPVQIQQTIIYWNTKQQKNQRGKRIS